MSGLDPKTRVNLERATVLLIDGNPLGMQILKQIFAGFGVRNPIRAFSAAEAKKVIQVREVNLVVANDSLPDMSGYDFIHWLRRSAADPNCFTPALIVSGHIRKSNVGAARDAGANFIVAKPLSPQVLIERIVWVAGEARPFIDAGAYLGPDRRFQTLDVPPENGRRREDQLTPAARAAAEEAKAAADDPESALMRQAS